MFFYRILLFVAALWLIYKISGAQEIVIKRKVNSIITIAIQDETYDIEEIGSTESKELFRYILEYENLRFKRVVIAQFLHETGTLGSKVYQECNNLFGMKQPYKRPTKALGTCRGHALYANKFDSIDDYFLFQKWSLEIYESKRGKVKSVEDYLTFLRRVGYAEDELYLRKIRNWLTKLPE